MLLRRLTLHIKEQNWFAVGLDLLVVISGIFLGMQVTEWNDDRKDRIDGEAFIDRIHNEILTSEIASSRVRERRLNLLPTLTDAATIVFDENHTDQLTARQCLAISTSHYLNIAISELPSLTELMSAGRVAIIGDNELRTALIGHQQNVGTLKENIQDILSVVHNLPIGHPTLISSHPYYDDALGEMQARYTCDLPAMRKNQAFRNALSENVDGYDVYLRDGLQPWSHHMSHVHSLLDNALGLEHSR